MSTETVRLVRELVLPPGTSDLPPAAPEQLAALLDLLAERDAPTSVHEPSQAIEIHIADSLVGTQVAELCEADLIVDLGAGAGLPGLVLAAALPRARLVLVESARRKCAFLERAITAMALDNADVVCARAEEWEAGRGRCDVVCARAVAALPVVCEYAAPLLRAGGVVVAWKGALAAQEALDAQAAAALLGLAQDPVRTVVPYAGSERRTLHILRKVSPTPDAFPRRAGVATKRPLSATSQHRS